MRICDTCKHFVHVDETCKLTLIKHMLEDPKDKPMFCVDYFCEKVVMPNYLEGKDYDYTKKLKLTLNSVYGLITAPSIKKVIFKEPATIVFWSDNTKTVVKCNKNDIFDPEKGLAMAVAKKVLGTNASDSNYYDIFKKYLKEYEKEMDK